MSSIDILRTPYFIKRFSAAFKIFFLISSCSTCSIERQNYGNFQHYKSFRSFLQRVSANQVQIFLRFLSETLGIESQSFETLESVRSVFSGGEHHFSFIFCLKASRSSGLNEEI